MTDLAHEVAQQLKRAVERQLRSLNTIALVTIVNVHRKDGAPHTADVQLKHEPGGAIIPGCRIGGFVGPAGVIVPPLTSGQTALALFSQVPLDDLVQDHAQYPLKQRGRFMSRTDCIIVGGILTDIDEISVPAGYDPETDMLIVSTGATHITAGGDATINGAAVKLGGATKDVARDGDTVTITGTDSQGGAISATGVVNASQGTTKA